MPQPECLVRSWVAYCACFKDGQQHNYDGNLDAVSCSHLSKFVGDADPEAVVDEYFRIVAGSSQFADDAERYDASKQMSKIKFGRQLQKRALAFGAQGVDLKQCMSVLSWHAQRSQPADSAPVACTYEKCAACRQRHPKLHQQFEIRSGRPSKRSRRPTAEGVARAARRRARPRPRAVVVVLAGRLLLRRETSRPGTGTFSAEKIRTTELCSITRLTRRNYLPPPRLRPTGETAAPTARGAHACPSPYARRRG